MKWAASKAEEVSLVAYSTSAAAAAAGGVIAVLIIAVGVWVYYRRRKGLPLNPFEKEKPGNNIPLHNVSAPRMVENKAYQQTSPFVIVFSAFTVS